MNEQEATLAAYKEYLLECANHDSLDYSAINKKYELKVFSYDWRDLGLHVAALHEGNLFRRKKRTVVVNGQTVPAPMDREPKTDEPFWCLTLTADNLANKFSEFCDIKHHHNLIRAGWFDNEQDASEYFKALLGIK